MADGKRLESIMNKTAEAINISRNEIFEILSNAQKDYSNLEHELNILKNQIKVLADEKEVLEQELKIKKMQMMLAGEIAVGYSQEDLSSAFAVTDNIRVELAVKKEQELYLLRNQSELEVRLRETYGNVQNALRLQTHVEVARDYLNGDLQNMVMHIDDDHQRKLMGLRIIKAQEEERQRVAREIHDGPAQSMSNVVLKAEICEKLINIDSTKAIDELRRLKSTVRECLADVRKIIYNLRPMMLDDLGLIATLQRLVLTFREETGIDAVFKTIGVFVDKKPEISLTIFRIVQESLSNITKHSKAQNATVNIDFKDSEIKLYIYDDGIGFDKEMLKEKNPDFDSGFGLYNMKERVEMLMGKFNLHSEPGKGTRINVTIPLLKEEGKI